MVSIIARPTKSVRESVPAASGWRAMASMAAAIDRPSARAGPMEPIETASTAPTMLMSLMSMRPPLASFASADGGADEDGCEHGEDVGLHEPDQELQHHERDRHEQAGERQDQRDHELAAHHVAEQAHHQGEGPRHLGNDIERQHDELRLGETGEVAERAQRSDAEVMHRDVDDEGERSRRLELAGRRFHARQQPREIGHRQEQEQRADERQERTAALADDLVDLAKDSRDDQLHHRLAPPRAALESAGREPGRKRERQHDGPSRHHRSRHLQRAEAEQEDVAEGRIAHQPALLATLRATKRAARKPKRDASSGRTPSLAAIAKAATAAARRAMVRPAAAASPPPWRNRATFRPSIAK